MVEVLFKWYLYFEVYINDNILGRFCVIKKLEILYRLGGKIEYYLVFIIRYDVFKGDIYY